MGLLRNIITNLRSGKKNHTTLKLGIMHKTHYPSFIIRVKEVVLFFSNRQKVSKPKVIAILLGGIFIAILVGVLFRNQISTFFSSTGADPVAYWKFDEGQGSTAQDSIESNDGTLGSGTSAPTWVADDQCISGTCLRFDGTNDYVNVGDVNALEFTGDFTLSLWFKTGATGTIQDLINYGSTNDWMYGIYFNANNTLSCKVFQNGNGNGYLEAISTENYRDSNWHHVSCTASGNNIYVYINGELAFSDTTTSGSRNPDTSGGLIIGSINSSSSTYFSGQIDEVKIYDYARSASQIKADYAARGSTKGVAAQFGDDDMSRRLSDGLFAYWKMDETVGLTGPSLSLFDSSGNNNTGVGVGDVGLIIGKFGNGGTFDGSGDYVSTGIGINTFNASDELTMNVWFKADVLESLDSFILQSQGQGNLGLSSGGGDLLIANMRIGGSNRNVTGTTTLTVGNWYMATFTVKEGVLSLYLNGVLDNSSDSGVTDINISAGTFDIARGGTPARHFDGTLDEVRFYNRALDPSEVKALYSFAPGPVVYHKFDEGTGTSTVIDSSGNNASGTLEGTVSESNWVSGKYGGAYDFSGDDYIESTDTMSVAGKSQFTIAAWFYLHDLDGSPNFFTEPVAANGNTRAAWGLNGSDQITLNVRDDDGDAGVTNCITDSRTLSTNTWTHIAVVYNADENDHKSYINGVPFSDSGSSGCNNPFGSGVNSTHKPKIATNHNGSSNFLDGYIDDFKMYSYARTAEQVIEDMNGGHPVGGSPVGSHVAYWKLNEMYGTTAYDASVNENDLTLSSASWSNAGKYGGAWNGTGSNWLSRADDDDFDVAADEDISISMWVKSDSATNPGSEEYILAKTNASVAGYLMGFSTDGYPLFAIDDDTNWTALDDIAYDQTDFYDGNWHHIVAVKKGTERIDVYVDGMAGSTPDTSIAATNNLANSQALVLGGLVASDAGLEFNGDIDEVKIYRTALTADQIKIEYNQGKTQVLGSVSTGVGGTTPSNSGSREYCVPGDSSTCNPPTIEWLLNEGTGSSANDTSGNGNIGTFISAPTWTTGKKGNGLLFDRNNMVGLTYNTSAPISGSAWIKPLSFQTGNIYTVFRRFTAATGDLDFYFRIRENSGFKQEFVHRASGNWQSKYGSITVTPGVWQHVAFTLTSGNVLTMYHNGQISYNASITVTTSENPGSTRDFSISDPGNGINGYMDEVRIYNYARTHAQVLWEYNRGAPVAYYKMDECTGTTINDWGINANGGYNGNNGTLTLGATGVTSAGTCQSSGAWADGATGKRGASISFDGTDDYINSGTGMPTFTSFTTMAWIKLDATPTDNRGGIVSRRDPSGFNFVVTTANKLAIYSSGSVNVTQTDSLSLDTWYHATAVRHGSTGYIYINGVLNTQASSGSDWVTGRSVIIGGVAGQPYYFPGQLDEVKIFNYALTPQQIKTEMAGGAVRFE